MLRNEGVDVVAKEAIPNILNPDRTDLCPFEKLAQSVTSATQLFSTLKSLFTEAKQ